MTSSWNLNNTLIDLQYSYESLLGLLSKILLNKNDFSHYEFALWCDNFTMIFDENELSPMDENAYIVARDIECQWDLFLINSYPLEELQNLDLSKVTLPQDCYIQWLKRLNER
ncbi:hypothetical protein KW850_07045 [Bacillus sp. sid0103]|uniref:hypothetical protein n=1 Tax=Bacillus sp. sid0103 TaxID=2856337 RepID=UPI001C485D6C|nr:hypothetical protein [Bacillus sp. sid0103]MBV7505012.1 hypothetical protein [Bacillus sp. sid0103]